MKKTLISFLVSLVITIFACSPVLAQCFQAQGSSLVPNITSIYKDSTHWWYQYINVTNITGETVQCKVSMYDHNGDDITHLVQVFTGSNGSNSWVRVPVADGIFDIPAHGTRMFYVETSGAQKTIAGYAVIEWSSTDTQIRKALIAGSNSIRKSGNDSNGGNFLINNGQPF